MSAGLRGHGVSAATASSVAHLPPISILFAAFLGYNPIQHVLGAHALASLGAANQAALTGRAFFPALISGAFRSGLDAAFAFAIVACLIAAAASWLRGGPAAVAAHSAPGLPAAQPQPEEQHAY
jgi:Na+/proline symporter